MDDSKTTRYIAIMLEEVKTNVQILLEVIQSMQVHVAKISKIESDVGHLKADVNVIKHVLKDSSVQLTDHEHRITKLEAGHSA